MGNIKKSIRPGQCYYEPYGRGYRIYRCVANSADGFVARAVEGEPTYRDREEAKSRVYELNGWGKPPPNLPEGRKKAKAGRPIMNCEL